MGWKGPGFRDGATDIAAVSDGWGYFHLTGPSLNVASAMVTWLTTFVIS